MLILFFILLHLSFILPFLYPAFLSLAMQKHQSCHEFDHVVALHVIYILYEITTDLKKKHFQLGDSEYKKVDYGGKLDTLNLWQLAKLNKTTTTTTTCGFKSYLKHLPHFLLG